MKKIAKKNLKLDKEVIASLSENEMVKVSGGDAPPLGPSLDKDTQLGCTTNGQYCGTRGLVCGGETGNCVTIPPPTNECGSKIPCRYIGDTIACLCSEEYIDSCPKPADPPVAPLIPMN